MIEMEEQAPFQTGHEGLIHDIAYDHFGTRLATASSDRVIRLFSRGAAGEWQEDCALTGHKGSIWKVRWAHPEFGAVLVSCSFDHKVRVWEETRPAGTGSDGVRYPSKWRMAAELSDARKNVVDVEFAPRHLGLKEYSERGREGAASEGKALMRAQASCSHDGFVRIYEAVDVLNLSHWSLSEEFEGGKEEHLQAISWNQCAMGTPAIAVGDAQNNIKESQIWEYSEQYRRWQTAVSVAEYERERNGAVREGVVRDVSWSPNLGRSYHLIASASSNGTAKIWKLKNCAPSGDGTWAVEDCFELGAVGGPEMWRVEWNITGTALATSCDDGTVRVYHQNIAKNAWEAQSAPIHPR